MAATAERQILLIFSGWLGLSVKQITTYFVLAKYRFIYEKINNNRIASKCRFWCSKFSKNLEALHHKMKQPRPIKNY